MRIRRLLVISLVGVLVLAAAGYGGDVALRSRQRHDQQRDYATGHAAYLRADCAKAVAALKKAQTNNRDHAVAARAAQDQTRCAGLQSLQHKAAALAPAEAVVADLGYLGDKPPAPLAAAARRDARTVLESQPLSKIATVSFCYQRLELAATKVLNTSHKDPLAAPFLAACGAARARTDPLGALQLYSQLQRDFPKTTQARTTSDDLGRVAVKVAKPWGAQDWPAAVPYGSDGSLRGQSRITLVESGPAPMTWMIVGASVRMVHVPACKHCVPITSDAMCRPGSDPSTTVTLPPGRYSLVQIDTRKEEVISGAGRWTLAADRQYENCFDTSPDQTAPF